MQNIKRKSIALLAVAFAIVVIVIFSLGKNILKNIEPEQKVKTTILEDDKKTILSGNDKDLSSQKDLVNKYVQNSQNLTIGEKCKMDPLVIKFKGDSILTIENKDLIMHTIAFENQNFFTVSPGEKREININETFKMNEGVLHYKCPDISQDNNVGVMYITAQ